MKVKEKSEKVGLKFNVQKTEIVAPSPITSWQIDGETVETVSDFIFWGSKITADGDGSHEIKRCLLLGRKVMTNLDGILKSRDINILSESHSIVSNSLLLHGLYSPWNSPGQNTGVGSLSLLQGIFPTFANKGPSSQGYGFSCGHVWM